MDIHNAYLHVHIDPPHQHFFCASQWQTTISSLSYCPSAYLLLPECSQRSLIALLRTHGIQVTGFLDYLLLKDLSFLSIVRRCPHDNSATPGLRLGDQFQQICPSAGILGSGPRTHPKQMSFSQKINIFLRAHAGELRSKRHPTMRLRGF